ncbi:MAG TPA: hypothetical protein VL123_04875 [Candidatus Udaeobacter sp.]|nr:hypothetical protein [Candidatus Udaeobacter sp.]
MAPPPDLRHPAFLIAALVAAACIAVTVTFVLYDTDMWQHLAVGRAIYALHAFPTRQLWTWPTYGATDVNASWGFRFLIWPIWKSAGIWGLFAWRWATTLATFALLFAAARKMGARGLAALIILVWCALVYRQRSQIRPETLVAVLLAAEIWILEMWRAGGRDRRPWLILIALLWANAHISYWLGLAVQGIYLVAGRGDPRAAASPLFARLRLAGWRVPFAVLIASALISLVNPWGFAALWQPFEYFLYWRHEPIFQTIGELQPLDWHYNRQNGLPILIVLWIALMVWRARRVRFDGVEALMFALVGGLSLPTERFLGFFAVVAAPFMARDLDAWTRSRTPASSGPGIHFTGEKGRGLWIRAAAVSILCVLIATPEWLRPGTPLGIGIDWGGHPVRACDFMESHGVRGHGMNQFAEGGYQLYRFWPDRSRLPFIDIHQTGTRDDRYLYAYAQTDSSAWRYLDNKYRFDYAVLYTNQNPKDRLLDFLDTDRAHWALVFSDDAAAVFIRREGPLAAIARDTEYQALPAGNAGTAILGRCSVDTTLRRRLERELERSEAESPWNARAKTLRAALVVLDGRTAQALQLLDQAIAQKPIALIAYKIRERIDLAIGRPREAMSDIRRAIGIEGTTSLLAGEMGRAYAGLRDTGHARDWYRRALGIDPANAAARDSLAALEGRGAR